MMKNKMETTIEGIAFGDHRERGEIYGFGLGVQGVIACNFREAKILRAEVSVVECKRPLNAGGVKHKIVWVSQNPYF